MSNKLLLNLIIIFHFIIKIESDFLYPDPSNKFGKHIRCRFKSNNIIEVLMIYAYNYDDILPDYFCCRCLSLYKVARDFKDNPMALIKTGQTIDILDLHCQKSKVVFEDKIIREWTDLIDDDGPLKSIYEKNCANQNVDYPLIRNKLYKMHFDKPRKILIFNTLYGRLELSKDKSNPTKWKVSDDIEFKKNILIADDFNPSKFGSNSLIDQIINKIPFQSNDEDQSFSNTPQICIKSLLANADNSNFDPVFYLTNDGNISRFYDQECMDFVQKIKKLQLHNYICLKNKKQLFYKIDTIDFRFMNLIVLDFEGSVPMSSGAEIWIEKQKAPSFDNLCSDSKDSAILISNLIFHDTKTDKHYFLDSNQDKIWTYTKPIAIFLNDPNKNPVTLCKLQPLSDRYENNKIKSWDQLQCQSVKWGKPSPTKSNKKIIIIISSIIGSIIVIGLLSFVGFKSIKKFKIDKANLKSNKTHYHNSYDLIKAYK